jgi:hypothetical protein
MQPSLEQILMIERFALINPYVHQIYTEYRHGTYTWNDALITMIYMLTQVSQAQQETIAYILSVVPYHIELPEKLIIQP